MSRTQTVFVVDDEAQVRRGLRLMLEAAGYEVETFAGGRQFLEAYDGGRPGCLLLDVRMPEMDGLALSRHLAAQGISLPVIFLSAHGDIPMAVRAIQEGAVDFLEKPADPSTLRRKVQLALEQNMQDQRQRRERNEILAHLDRLTPREREVLDYLIQGKTVKAIAHALGSKESTVRVQRASIYRKMRADSATDLLRMMTLAEQAPSPEPGA